MLSVALVGIEHEGNLGAVARVMKNFGVEDLILIDPQCDPLSEEALNRAKHAGDILKNAKTVPFEHLKSFDILIGTTAKLGSEYNIPRVPVWPDDLAKQLSIVKSRIVLIMGREGIGLTNEEIEQCDFTVTIPTSAVYRAMNVSHALAILLYEIFKESHRKKIASRYTPSSKQEKDIILEKLDSIMERLSFSTEQKKETQRRVWKRMLGKAMLTKREAFALLGLLRKLE